MTRRSPLPAVLGVVAGLALAGAAALVEGAGLRGLMIGSGLGIVNLAGGYLAIRRSLQLGIRSALTIVIAGFAVRLIVVSALTFVFQRSAGVSPVTFVATFFLFFFGYLVAEVLMVQRSLGKRPQGPGTEAQETE